MESEDSPACRICLECECDDGDELLAPCLCRGTAKYVHRQCLDQWRISGFDPKTVTHCGTCKAQFKLQNPDSAIGAEREVWLQIARFVGLRLTCFAVVVFVLGFVPPAFLGFEETQLFANFLLNHLTMGTASTLLLVGGYAILQALWSLNIMNLHRWDPGGKDSIKYIVIIIIVIGTLYLLYQLAKGIWEIAQTGRDVASANLRHLNKEMRTKIVLRYPVLNYEDAETNADCKTDHKDAETHTDKKNC